MTFKNVNKVNVYILYWTTLQHILWVGHRYGIKQNLWFQQKKKKKKQNLWLLLANVFVLQAQLDHIKQPRKYSSHSYNHTHTHTKEREIICIVKSFNCTKFQILICFLSGKISKLCKLEVFVMREVHYDIRETGTQYWTVGRILEIAIKKHCG